MNGYAGKILRVNLSKGEVSTEPLTEKMARDYIGGRGFAAKILYDEVPKGTDPLGEHNKLILASGPLAGTLVPGAGKITLAALSPATGSYGDSNMGGHIATELRYAGYDVIVVEGKSTYPAYLYIDDEVVEIRDATGYWGKGALQTETLLKCSLGDDFQICTIGPAGENLVKYACVSHDFGRQAGRTGTGTVMGSKKLKAVAIRGSKSIPLANFNEALKIGRELFRDCMAHPALKEWQDYGTAGVVEWANEIGAFPTRNFQSGYFEDYKNLSGKVMRKHIVKNDKACFCCPMCCGKYSHVKTPTIEFYVEGPEYETTALVGGNCAIGKIEDVAYINWLCDDLGLDTISAGNVIGFVMECYEKGLLNKSKTDGLELKFGNVVAAAALLHKIAKREGIGDMLAEGVRFASEKIGKGSEKFAIQVKGLEWSGYESRNAPAMMLSYLTSDIGAHHNRSWAITHDIAVGRDQVDGKAQKVVQLQHIRPMFDMLGLCRLQWVELAIDLNKYATVFKAITGINYNLDDLLKASERVWNLTRLFLLREQGLKGKEHDKSPARFYEERVPSGPSKGKVISKEEIQYMLDDYYHLRGWTSDGVPTLGKLKELGLDAMDIPQDILEAAKKPVAITPKTPPKKASFKEVPAKTLEIKKPAPAPKKAEPSKPAAKKPAPKKAAAPKPAAKKPVAKKAAAPKPAAKKPVAKKAAAPKFAAKKPVAKKAAAPKPAAKKPVAKKAAAPKPAAKKPVAKKASTPKPAAKKPTPKKAPAKKR
ncbi:MAG: aldehyde ferredoxin oxidoreductase family protein [bacterium]